ncbi:MAG: hypothetical protein AAF197_11560, partial [Pseudomonadota bacterium]
MKPFRMLSKSSFIFGCLLIIGCTQQDESTLISADERSQEDTTQASNTVTGIPAGLPQLTPCIDTSQPRLPEKWTATALMQTFAEHDVIVGKFTFDEAEQAYRFTLSSAGANGYADYLLTADQRLYRLQGGYEEPQSCRYSLMLQMELPTRDLMSPSAQCVGEGGINGIPRQWWKDRADNTPGSSNKGANWYWFTTDEQRSLFRMMPYKGVDNFGWAGKYSFTYF